MQTTQFGFSLSTLFVIFTSCGLKWWVKSLHLQQYVVPSYFAVFVAFNFDYMFFMLYNVGSNFLTKYLMCFNGIEIPDMQFNNYFANLLFCSSILFSCSFILSYCSFILFSCFFIFRHLIKWCNLYFTKFNKNIKTLCIRINPVKKIYLQNVFLFLFIFRFLHFDFCQYVLFRQFLLLLHAQKNTCQFSQLHVMQLYFFRKKYF